MPEAEISDLQTKVVKIERAISKMEKIVSMNEDDRIQLSTLRRKEEPLINFQLVIRG